MKRRNKGRGKEWKGKKSWAFSAVWVLDVIGIPKALWVLVGGDAVSSGQHLLKCTWKSPAPPSYHTPHSSKGPTSLGVNNCTGNLMWVGGPEHRAPALWFITRPSWVNFMNPIRIHA